MRSISKFFGDDSGASAAEYALIIGLITVALVAAIGTLGTAIQGAMTAAAAIINP